MAAVRNRGPDAWLIADEEADLWAAGTIVDVTQVLVHAPLDLLRRPKAGLLLVASREGRPESFPGVVQEVTLLADGVRPGHVFALLRVQGAQLPASPEVLRELMIAAVRDRVPAGAADESTGDAVPEVPRPPSVPRAPREPGDSAPGVLIDRRPDEVTRPWYCVVMPWLCHLHGPGPDQGLPENVGPSVSDPGQRFPSGL